MHLLASNYAFTTHNTVHQTLWMIQTKWISMIGSFKEKVWTKWFSDSLMPIAIPQRTLVYLSSVYYALTAAVMFFRRSQWSQIELWTRIILHTVTKTLLEASAQPVRTRRCPFKRPALNFNLRHSARNADVGSARTVQSEPRANQASRSNLAARGVMMLFIANSGFWTPNESIC